MNKLNISVYLLLLPLIGCTVSTTNYSTWNKPGLTTYEAENALAKCKYDLGLAKVDAMQKDEMVNNCMKAQGFRTR